MEHNAVLRSNPNSTGETRAATNPTAMSRATRRRVAVACTACRKRQVKCEQRAEEPCTTRCERCKKLNIPCEYVQVAHMPAYPPASELSPVPQSTRIDMHSRAISAYPITATQLPLAGWPYDPRPSDLSAGFSFQSMGSRPVPYSPSGADSGQWSSPAWPGSETAGSTVPGSVLAQSYSWTENHHQYPYSNANVAAPTTYVQDTVTGASPTAPGVVLPRGSERRGGVSETWSFAPASPDPVPAYGNTAFRSHFDSWNDARMPTYTTPASRHPGNNASSSHRAFEHQEVYFRNFAPSNPGWGSCRSDGDA